MKTYRVIKKAEGGKITIDIPDTFNGKELIITIRQFEPRAEEIRKFKEVTGQKD